LSQALQTALAHYAQRFLSNLGELCLKADPLADAEDTPLQPVAG
jgi:hypothetical protein